MSSHLSVPLRHALGAVLSLSSLVGAQALATDSRITQVKVYPGSATVERVARVSAASKTLTFACLPATLDVQSLQVSADATVRIGETSVLTEARETSARCGSSPLDARIRDLEDQKASLQAETDALTLVTGYLKGLSGSGSDASDKRLVADAQKLAGVAEALRRTGRDALLKQHQISRQQSDIQRQLNPLLAERKREQGTGGNVIAVTVALTAESDADVKLSYQINGPGWTPTYRALLDTATRKVRIERQALVAQSTGEDWRGVKLVLSTGQPRRETTGRIPSPWRIGIEPPPVPTQRRDIAMPLVAAAAPSARKVAPPEAFDISVFDNSFTTEFSIAKPIDVPSSGQRVAMSLGQHEDKARLAVRTSPRIDASGYLIADLAVPAGVWPTGPMQLYRDGSFVGTGQWNSANTATLTLSFGHDELVRVQAEPERDGQGTGGFIGSRAERRVQRAYVIENRHKTPITVQVLEAAPVSVDDQVQVAVEFAPEPAERTWENQPGLAMWVIDVDAGKSARVAASYVIGYPKDKRLQER